MYPVYLAWSLATNWELVDGIVIMMCTQGICDNGTEGSPTMSYNGDGDMDNQGRRKVRMQICIWQVHDPSGAGGVYQRPTRKGALR